MRATRQRRNSLALWVVRVIPRPFCASSSKGNFYSHWAGCLLREAGYRYSQLAAAYYNANLTNEDIGRSQLPAIRKRETIAVGKILGVRHHYFLDQKDTRYTLDISEPLAAWNTQQIHSFLCALLKKEQYSFVFTLLPGEEKHGHHKAAALLAVLAADSLAAGLRPVILGADPAESRSSRISI